jgi:hypothetical protein
MIPFPASAIILTLFPRLLGAIYLIAFASLLVQLRGLYGAQGILPIAEYTVRLRRHFAPRAWRLYPSLFWLNAGDPVLLGAAWAGIALSLLLLAGFFVLPALLLLWLLYLSFTSLGQDFLSFQWDALLLETGFMTIFLPLADPASPVVAFAYHFFLFRFMLSAGVVKLASGDPNWRQLRALLFHYETQPLPNKLAWYAHQLPAGVQKLSCLGTFFFELVVPILCLGPAPLRLVACALLLFFQTLLLLSGSYGFFNLLTMLLCVPLLDDRFLASFDFLPAAAEPLLPTLSPLVSTLFLLFILLNGLQLLRLATQPRWLAPILGKVGRWGISSPYGLFSVMTTTRYEYIIEGSNDGEDWQAYAFGWKPGDPAVPPRQAAPHQPRLDWQMWFAALDPTNIDPWFARLLKRLLEGSPPVLALFRHIPFRVTPPRLLRLTVYQYHFTDGPSRRGSGHWWQRSEIGRSAPIAQESL